MAYSKVLLSREASNLSINSTLSKELYDTGGGYANEVLNDPLLMKPEELLELKSTGRSSWDQLKRLLYKRYFCAKTRPARKKVGILLPVVVVALVMYEFNVVFWTFQAYTPC